MASQDSSTVLIVPSDCGRFLTATDLPSILDEAKYSSRGAIPSNFMVFTCSEGIIERDSRLEKKINF